MSQFSPSTHWHLQAPIDRVCRAIVALEDFAAVVALCARPPRHLDVSLFSSRLARGGVSAMAYPNPSPP